MKFAKEIASLVDKARRSLKAAKMLFSEGDYDFAISRAYYAMFYCAEAVLLTREMKFKKHSAVIIAMFGKEFIKTGFLPKKLHQYLISVYKEREKSDYESMLLQSEQDAQEVLKKAEEFVSEIEKFLSNRGYNIKKEL